MAIPVTPGSGATIAAQQREGGLHQQVAQFPIGRAPLMATFWLATSGTTMLIGSGVASADMALITLDPGAGIRWLTAASSNASIGHPLMAQGSYPEALEIVGSAQLATLRVSLLGGETTVAKLNLEFYRFVL